MKYFIIFFLCAFATPAHAQDTDSSGRNDHLFQPTSKKQMREFATDRPDVTESAYTVDAGHFQCETDLFKTERTKIESIKTINNYYNVINLKLGITHSLDIQVVAGSLFTSRINDGNSINKKSGFGGLSFRAKQNLWGNDGGETALAILPFINIPTASSEKISGGIVIPFAISLPHEWGIGAQVETDIADDETGNNYHFNFLASGTVSHSLFKNLDFFVEGVITRDNEIKSYEYFLDGGLVYALSKNINTDCGVYYGLKGTSSKTYFLGLSFRL